MLGKKVVRGMVQGREDQDLGEHLRASESTEKMLWNCCCLSCPTLLLLLSLGVHPSWRAEQTAPFRGQFWPLFLSRSISRPITELSKGVWGVQFVKCCCRFFAGCAGCGWWAQCTHSCGSAGVVWEFLLWAAPLISTGLSKWKCADGR